MSGLWPVAENDGSGRTRDVHPVIWERVQKSRSDELGAGIIEKLERDNLLPDCLRGFKPQFFRAVSPDPTDNPNEKAAAAIGQAVLGNRHRWAVIAMDGNDIGSQFQAPEIKNTPPDVLPQILSEMSTALKTYTETAFRRAISSVIEQWANAAEAERGGLVRYCVGDSNTLILPFRPLLLGGDDVTLLSHSAYAMPFVQHMAQAFQKESQCYDTLWPATHGQLTMSAGLLYCKTSFPLSMALPYAEELLRYAKNHFRHLTPTPAAVDWDTITDTLVDTPASRRQRELFFRDGELDLDIGLTRRPYTLGPDGPKPRLSDLITLQSNLVKANVSPTVLSRILPALKRPWSERIAFIASIAKRHGILMQQLWEGDQLGEAWEQDENDPNLRLTGFLDALLLLDEAHRMMQTTTGS